MLKKISILLVTMLLIAQVQVDDINSAFTEPQEVVEEPTPEPPALIAAPKEEIINPETGQPSLAVPPVPLAAPSPQSSPFIAPVAGDAVAIPTIQVTSENQDLTAQLAPNEYLVVITPDGREVRVSGTANSDGTFTENGKVGFYDDYGVFHEKPFSNADISGEDALEKLRGQNVGSEWGEMVEGQPAPVKATTDLTAPLPDPNLIRTIEFVNIENDFDAKQRKELNTLVEYLNQNPAIDVVLNSYSDKVNDDPRYSGFRRARQVAFKRANSTKKYLEKSGIRTSRIKMRIIGTPVNTYGNYQSKNRIDVMLAKVQLTPA
jgi:outer membrane protein OmpA-like peptidoglycan-associated protein